MYRTILFILVALILAFVAFIRSKTKTATPVGPQPPIVSGPIPFIGTGIDWLKNPRDFLNKTRKEVGDIFILHAFGLRLFCVFSNSGLEDFYKVPEIDASFQEATRGFLGFKVPAEIMSGTLNVILPVLQRNFQNEWLRIFNQNMADEFASMGQNGKFDVFQWTKRMVHKSGFRVWVGEEAISDKYFSKITQLYETIDPEQGFTDMSSLGTTILTRRSKERKALHSLVEIFKTILLERTEKKSDFLESLYEGYKDLDEKKRFLQVTIDVVVLHMASQSNLFAAIAWTIINLIRYPKYGNEVVAVNSKLEEEFGERFIENPNALQRMELLEQSFHESIRLSQQSLTLRLVLKNIQIDGYTVVPGYYIATLLSCMNQQEDKFKEGPTQFLPEKHYLKGGNINLEAIEPGCQYSISTFGHGTHSCPGKRFAILLAKTVVSKLFMNYRLELEDPDVKVKNFSSTFFVFLNREACHHFFVKLVDTLDY